MKLLFIALSDILKYLITNGNKKEWKSFLYAFFQITFVTIFGTLTAPIFWPIYYILRFHLFTKIQLPTCRVTDDIDTNLYFKKAKNNLNWFEYFILMYGDKYSPLCNKLPDFFLEKHKNKSWFWKYFIFSAIRNPFFNYHYAHMITKNEVKSVSNIKIIIDNRTNQIIDSDGITSFKSGKYFFWREDKEGNPYFCYRNNTNKYLFYVEYCGLENLYGYDELNCRLEISIRKIKK